MRLLFAMPPGMGLLFPFVPLAHANVSTGHRTLVATTGATLRGAADAGLHTVDVAPNEDVDQLYRGLGEAVNDPAKPEQDLIDEMFGRFGEISAMMLDGVVEVAETWHADAIVYPPTFPAGLIAARVLGATAVLHQIGLPGATLISKNPRLAAAAGRHGVVDLPREPDIEIDLLPESLRGGGWGPSHNSPTTLAMRYGSYQGGAVLPSWLFSRSAAARVTITLGSMGSTMGRGELLHQLIRGIQDLDVELVVTTAGRDVPALPRPVPDNVRLVDWLPLSALLPTSSAVVHHGGAGSTFAALVAGTPQLVIPAGGDRSMNAALVHRRGVGMTLAPPEVTPETLTRALCDLLEKPAYRAASDEVVAEMAAMPTPLSVASRIAEHLAQSNFARTTGR
jgi:glycosyltransferase